MNTYKIEWNGKSYRAADITIFAGKENELTVTIADTTLEDELLSHMDAGDKLENKAVALDIKICFFIFPHDWKLDEEHLVKIVESSYDAI